MKIKSYRPARVAVARRRSARPENRSAFRTYCPFSYKNRKNDGEKNASTVTSNPFACRYGMYCVMRKRVPAASSGNGESTSIRIGDGSATVSGVVPFAAAAPLQPRRDRMMRPRGDRDADDEGAEPQRPACRAHRPRVERRQRKI